MSLVNTLIYHRQCDFSIEKRSWRPNTARESNTVGFVAYKHNSTLLKQDDGISNADKHPKRMKPEP